MKRDYVAPKFEFIPGYSKRKKSLYIIDHWDELNSKPKLSVSDFKIETLNLG